MSELLFSIIIPTYNRAKFIKKTIHSILNQSYVHFEIIVVDDGSSDNTEDIVKEIQDSRVNYYKIKNSERGAARNVGIAKSKGDYITFLDSDDILYSHYFYTAKQLIESHNFPFFAHIGYEMRNEENKVVLRINNLKSNDYNMLLQGNPLGCIGVFLKKEITSEYRFNEDRNLSGSEDWELWFRILARFGIITDSTICACMLHHDARSVVNTNENKLILRKNIALNSIFSDSYVIKRYATKKNYIESYFDTYIALHLALEGNITAALKYFKYALQKNMYILFSKRSLVICKLWILNLFRRTEKTFFL